MAEITTIFFDFVGVLLVFAPKTPPSREVRAVDRRIGRVVDDRAFRQSVVEEYGFSAEQFEAVLDQVVDLFEPFEPLWRILPDLRQRFRLGIINNGTYLTYPRFNARYAIDRQFGIFVSSAVEGMCKPDPRIYLRACEKLGVLPQNCLFMDDDPANVGGAIQAGMQGLMWESHLEGFQKFLGWLGE